MLKKLSILLIFIFLLPFSANAYWVSLDKDAPEGTPPKVSLLDDNGSSTTIKVELAGFEVKEFTDIANGKTYNSIDLFTDIFTTKEGYPEIPYIAKILAIPNNGGVSVEVIETGEMHSFTGFHIAPARHSWIEGEPETLYKENAEIYKAKTEAGKYTACNHRHQYTLRMGLGCICFASGKGLWRICRNRTENAAKN